ncbi:hypothetical protein [Sulfitobacter mediterraneus]|jgi:hypothetical protein|uniref:Uncharacterized protein n=1 Tax=Sulfitobacter mediterraneus TaxID=83219 RepID=A0A2T6CGW6_9RHOB|nr:hypothetical protein [Sulfitobacter mediterraneus]PTX74749.1 hypothetical protein C8N31_103226 [Sulfitobacter mediterraneus]
MRYLRNVLDRKSKALHQSTKCVVIQYIQADDEGNMLEIAEIFSDGTVAFIDGRKEFIGLEGLDLKNGFEPWVWPDGELSGQMYDCTEQEYFAVRELVQKLLFLDRVEK